MDEAALRKRLAEDFPTYARTCLSIRTKSGAIQPLELNFAQRYTHDLLNRQKTQTGRTRAIILKARQLGISTYIAARFYHQTTHNLGTRTLIIAHEQAAADGLFAMVNRFHEHAPDPFKPRSGTANVKALEFPNLDSGYRVATAGSTRSVGRGETIQLAHLSEQSFWPNAEENFTAILQAIPSGTQATGTEAIVESTANGASGTFYDLWQQAESQQSEFIPIFLPWFNDPNYRLPLLDPQTRKFPKDQTSPDLVDPQTNELPPPPSPEEATYANHHGLDFPQILWRRAKLRELGDPSRFAQEYPATSQEAFQQIGHDPLIDPALVLKARRADPNLVTPSGPLTIGVDPARYGDARSAIVMRQGRVVTAISTHANLDTMALAGLLVTLIKKHKPARMFIDIGGLGAGVYDRLRELGYKPPVSGVQFGERAFTHPNRFINRRAEMWGTLKEWFEAEEAPVRIPDNDQLHTDLISLTYSYDSSGRLKLESKEAARKRGVRSPDLGDALALTFAAPTPSTETRHSTAQSIERHRKAQTHLMAGPNSNY